MKRSLKCVLNVNCVDKGLMSRGTKKTYLYCAKYFFFEKTHIRPLIYGDCHSFCATREKHGN